MFYNAASEKIIIKHNKGISAKLKKKQQKKAETNRKK